MLTPVYDGRKNATIWILSFVKLKSLIIYLKSIVAASGEAAGYTVNLIFKRVYYLLNYCTKVKKLKNRSVKKYYQLFILVSIKFDKWFNLYIRKTTKFSRSEHAQ